LRNAKNAKALKSPNVAGEGISDYDEDESSQDLEPEPSEYYDDEYRNTPWNPDAQIQAQLDDAKLAQLYTEIKARAELPNPPYKKLFRFWPLRPFDVRILPEYVQHPIHYFELFWGLEVWNTLIENTNAYAQYKEAWHKENISSGQKSRWWKAVTLYEMRIFIALLIYIGIVGTSNIASFWNKSRNTIHKPMELMTYYRFSQIKRYFHVSALDISRLSIARWHTKLEPLANMLCTKFQAYVVLGQNVSFDEIMVPYSRRSQHTLKMKNKPISEGFKVWALCDYGYL
jgi:Transposase IS4